MKFLSLSLSHTHTQLHLHTPCTAPRAVSVRHPYDKESNSIEKLI